jgi:hypothetical protein
VGLAASDTAHNTVMAVLVSGGLAATAIFVATVVGVARAVVRTGGLLRVALGTTLAVWLITSMVGSVEESRVTWLLFGMMALAGRLEVEQPDEMVRVFSGQERRELKVLAYAGRQTCNNFRFPSA